MSWFAKKPRSDISSSLRRLRRRVLEEGETFFRVVVPAGARSAEFDTRNEAENYALDLASYFVGDSLFVSERRRLDGVQVQVSCKEFSFSFLDGMRLPHE